MTSRSALFLAAMWMAAFAGCQLPSASRQTAPVLGPQPIAEESSFNPLGKIEKSVIFAPVLIRPGTGNRRDLFSRTLHSRPSTGCDCTAGSFRILSRGRSCSFATATAAT